MYGLFQTTFYFGYMALFSMALGLMCGKYHDVTSTFIYAFDLYYTPRNEVRGGGVYWNHPVCPSVCRRAWLGKITQLGIGCRGGYFVPLGQPHSSWLSITK